MQESFLDGIHFCLVFFFHNYLALILLLKIYIKRLELKITLSSLPHRSLNDMRWNLQYMLNGKREGQKYKKTE